MVVVVAEAAGLNAASTLTSQGTAAMYAALTPEANVTALTSGAGAAPYAEAATGWQAIASSLRIAATNLQLVVAATGQPNDSVDSSVGLDWQGQAAQRFRQAVSGYINEWLTPMTEAAETLSEASTAQAAAYTTAVATSPTLAQISANRASLSTLQATNWIGQNTAAIAENEAEYMTMWADAAMAMTVYSAASDGVIAALESFPPPVPITAADVRMAVAMNAIRAATATPPDGNDPDSNDPSDEKQPTARAAGNTHKPTSSLATQPSMMPTTGNSSTQRSSLNSAHTGLFGTGPLMGFGGMFPGRGLLITPAEADIPLPGPPAGWTPPAEELVVDEEFARPEDELLSSVEPSENDTSAVGAGAAMGRMRATQEPSANLVSLTTKQGSLAAAYRQTHTASVGLEPYVEYDD